MNHLLDPFNYLFGYDLGNPIEDGKAAQMLNIYKGCENLVQNMRSYEYHKPKKILYGRTSRDAGSIEGECTVIEINGKKLLGDVK